MKNSDEYYMKLALEAANEALSIDEVPIGALIIDKNENILAKESNKTIKNNDPTAHAEILALRKAALKINNYRLTECVLYTTIEPCVMCAGALVNARIKRLVYGSTDIRFGGAQTVFNICNNSSLNHQIEIKSDVLSLEAKKLIQDFFKTKRAKK